MLEFAHPLLLLLLLGVPLLIWWWLHRRPVGLRFPGAVLLERLPSGRSRWVRWGGAGMRGSALGLAVVALAGPRYPDLHTRIPTEGIAIQMLADVSGSMAERDYQWGSQPVSRLEAAKRAFHLLIEGGSGPGGQTFAGRHDDLVGLVVFATLPESACPLTLSHGILLQMLDDQRPRTLPNEAQTNVGDAIAWGLHRLESAGNQRRVMILLSDGEHNVPPPALTPRQAAQLAANEGVPIYCVDAGAAPGASRAGAAEGSADDAAERREDGIKTLKGVASITGGRYFRAADTNSLLAACAQIDRLERQTIQSFEYRRYYEMYPWIGLAAFVFLVSILGLEQTVWQRLP